MLYRHFFFVKSAVNRFFKCCKLKETILSDENNFQGPELCMAATSLLIVICKDTLKPKHFLQVLK